MKKIIYAVLALVLALVVSCDAGGKNLSSSQSIISSGTDVERVLGMYKMVSSQQSKMITVPDTRAIPLETYKLSKIPEWLIGTWDYEFEYQGELYSQKIIVEKDNIYMIDELNNMASDIGSYVIETSDETFDVATNTYSIIQNGHQDWPIVITRNVNDEILMKLPQQDWNGLFNLEGILNRAPDLDIMSGSVISGLEGVKGIMIIHNPLAGFDDELIQNASLANYFDVFFSYENFHFNEDGIEYILSTGTNGYSHETSRFYSIQINDVDRTTIDSTQYTGFNYKFSLSDGSTSAELELRGSYTMKAVGDGYKIVQP